MWFGDLPDFFPFWHKSLEINKEYFSWKLFTDQNVESSEALDVHQYSPSILKDEIEAFFGEKYKINIESDHFIRKCCDYRLLLPLIHGDVNSPFWGWCDIDLVFGDIASVLPPDWKGTYGLTTHPGRFAGPFSFVSTKIYEESMKCYYHKLSSDAYNCIDESPAMLNAIKKNWKVLDDVTYLQPTRSLDALPQRKSFGTWKDGRLQIATRKGYVYAAMMHFGKLKGHKKFTINKLAINSNQWYCSKYGINKKKPTFLSYIRFRFSNLFRFFCIS